MDYNPDDPTDIQVEHGALFGQFVFAFGIIFLGLGIAQMIKKFIEMQRKNK